MADLRENVVEFYADDKRATGTFTQGRYVSKIKKLAEKYPDECQIVAENSDSSIVAHFPVRWIRIQPNKGREFTEEEKDAFRARMMQNRR